MLLCLSSNSPLSPPSTDGQTPPCLCGPGAGQTPVWGFYRGQTPVLSFQVLCVRQPRTRGADRGRDAGRGHGRHGPLGADPAAGRASAPAPARGQVPRPHGGPPEPRRWVCAVGGIAMQLDEVPLGRIIHPRPHPTLATESSTPPPITQQESTT